MTSITENIGDVQISQTKGEKKRHIINSRDIPVNQTTIENGIFIPFKTAIDGVTGKEVVSSWVEVKGEIIDKGHNMLDELEKKKIEEDPHSYEFNKTKRLSPSEQDRYETGKMYIMILENLINNHEPVPLTQNIVDRALNVTDKEIDQIKKEIASLRDQKKIKEVFKPRLGERKGFNADIVSEYLDRRDDQKEADAKAAMSRKNSSS